MQPADNNHIILAGPCSAESEKQLFDAATAIQSRCPHAIFRAGLWKPRTHQGTFEGVGEAGIPWLQRLQNECNLPVATEVATPEHLRLCLQAGITHLWIGARTTSNPIMLQNLADALHEWKAQQPAASLTIYIKNPINPDIELWIGAIERIRKAGITHIVAVHRGFSTLYKSEWRNPPVWSIPMELRRRYPHLPLLCDPSHIAGKACNVSTIAQQAITIGFDGLMIECHCCPAQAMSDAEQQLTPNELQTLLQNLPQRQAQGSTAHDNTLLELRQQIDEIDDELWQLIARRLEIAQQIGQYKRQHQLPVLQTQRYQSILQKRIQWAAQHGISEPFVCQLMEALHAESVQKQL